jgi:diguanylate cyclase (GGDEF)-like protein
MSSIGALATGGRSGRVGGRGGDRFAIVGLGCVLALMTGSAMTAAAFSYVLSARVDRAHRIEDSYSDTLVAVTNQESLLRDYPLEPSPKTRSAYAAQDLAFDTSTAAIARQTGGPDATLNKLLVDEQKFDAIATSIMDAVDRGDAATAAAIDAGVPEPADVVVEALHATEAPHQRLNAAVAAVRQGDVIILWALPVEFVAGLGLLGLFARMSRGHRRRFDSQARRHYYDARHDLLTGIPNRRGFLEIANDSLASALSDGSCTGLLMLDLDRFKTINDARGHHVGDEVLVQIGPRISSVVRECDTVCRLGGDEFAVVLPRIANATEALAIAENVLACFDEPFAADNTTFVLSGTVGVSVAPDHGLTVPELLQRGDLALYAAKETGRKCHRLFEPAMEDAAVARLAVEADLGVAIANGELFLDYQPVVSLATGAMSGVEALARWRHPRRGLVPPSEFIPVAEESELITSIGSWVLAQACAQARVLQDRYPRTPPLTMAVNISICQLEQPGFIDEVSRCVQDAGLDPASVILEITESRLGDESDEVLDVLRSLADLGLRLSIDDFGTGYSSLTRLRSFPMNELKIDRSFVKALGTPDDSYPLVAATINMAHSLGLSVVAEGVELPAQLQSLRQLGCDFVQGYLISMPTAATALNATISVGSDLVAMFLPPDRQRFDGGAAFAAAITATMSRSQVVAHLTTDR